MAVPLRTTGSLGPGFPSARLDRPRSQAPIYPCARRPIADRAEGALELLRYSLGGIRPRQTAHLALFPARIHGTRLGPKCVKSGISPIASTSAGTEASKAPTYGPTHEASKLNTRLQ